MLNSWTFTLCTKSTIAVDKLHKPVLNHKSCSGS